MIQVGSAYTNVVDNKIKSLTGYFGNGRLVIIPNQYKQSDNHPDYKLCVSRKKGKDEGKDISTPLAEIAALWKNEKNDGETFLKGNFGKASVLVFKNQYKEEDSHPDWNVFIAKNEKEQDD